MTYRKFGFILSTVWKLKGLVLFYPNELAEEMMKKKVVTELEISREAMYKSLDKLLKKWRISSCQTRLVSCTNGSKVRTQISTDSVVIKKLKEFREYLKKTDYPKFNFFNFVKNNRMKVVFRENNVVIKGSTLTNHTELVENFFREASEKKF